MRHLPLPATLVDEKKVLAKLAKDALWAPHAVVWEQAYDDYLAAGGDPHVVTASAFTAAVGKAQAKLYEGRRRTKPLDAIRRQAGLLSCPSCGSSSQGSLDHYLPKDEYGEFSIMRANLVPACNHCNSDEKGTAYKGAAPARLVHPYFDNWVNAAVWQVRIVAPLSAPTFVPEALPGLTPARRAIVDFHLLTVVGKQFRTAMGNWWSTLPPALAPRLAPPVSAEALNAQLALELVVAEATTWTNSWQSAAFRGLIANSAAVADLLARL